MAGLSGLAVGMTSLLAARAVMGLSEGAFLPGKRQVDGP